MELHRAGCADVARTLKTHRTKSNEQADASEDFSAATAAELVVAIDTEWAGMFGEKPYTQSARDNGCWTVATGKQAPCFAAMLKGLVYDGSSAPTLAAAPAVAAAYPCKGKWSRCGGQNERSARANWNLCPDCTANRAAEMAAAR